MNIGLTNPLIKCLKFILSNNNFISSQRPSNNCRAPQTACGLSAGSVSTTHYKHTHTQMHTCTNSHQTHTKTNKHTNASWGREVLINMTLSCQEDGDSKGMKKKHSEMNY